MADAMREKVAWMYAVYRWRIKPTVGLTLKGLSQSQQYEATDMSRAVLDACHHEELVVALGECLDALMGKGLLKDGHNETVCARARALLAKVKGNGHG